MEFILNMLELTDDEKKQYEDACAGHRLIYVPLGKHEDGLFVSGEEWKSATVIVGAATPGSIKTYPEKLKFLQARPAGPDSFLKKGLLPEGCIVAGSQGAYGQSVSEHMFAMMWGLMKLLPQYRDNQHEGLWEDLGGCKTLVGANVLIIGTGDLGSSFARLVKPFGAHTFGMRRDRTKEAPGIDKMFGFEEADKLLGKMDVVINMAPAGPLTDGFMTKERFRLMKKDAIFLNGGRGSFVSSDVLNEVLDEGLLFGAGIDVTDTEPLPKEHPLWKQKRCLITPHKAGLDKIPATFRKVVQISLENLTRYLKGEDVINRIQ